MFELPETVTLADQINESLTGKIIQKGQLGNSPTNLFGITGPTRSLARLLRAKG
jgi:hypothetical protein